MSRFKNRFWIAIFVGGIPWVIVIFGWMSFGMGLETLHPILLKFLLFSFVASVLIFIFPVIVIERYFPSNLVAILRVYLLFFRNRKAVKAHGRKQSLSTHED